MPFAVELSDKAAETLLTVPVDISMCIHRHLEELAQNPISLGRKAHFPYRPIGQIYQFWCHYADTPYFITVFFHFKAGEDVIRIFAITTQTFPPPLP